MPQCDLRLRVPLVIATSEAMSSEARLLAARVLNAEVLHSYGAGERVAFAWSERLDDYVFFQGYGWVELIPVEESRETITYEIVGTGFWNLAMPLVRYRMSDLITLPKGTDLNAIRWGLQPFKGVQGRQSDFLISPDGVRLMGIDHFPREVDNVLRMQVIQPAPDFVRIQVIPAEGFSEANIAQIMQNVRRKLPQSMRVQVEVVEELVKTPTGKTPYVIREFEP
jgi:phenylacetate-CoA ligase